MAASSFQWPHFNDYRELPFPVGHHCPLPVRPLRHMPLRIPLTQVHRHHVFTPAKPSQRILSRPMATELAHDAPSLPTQRSTMPCVFSVQLTTRSYEIAASRYRTILRCP
ncbi:hypothetical protein HBI56_029300 [Parastagonospora nodorum]|uniref:Uncharacterized protein n=1 Tax=Phaeosphaeria nodorum (strain SN15 / ATCC MYA-4574 / FGSC 10173) TaxID=321614 RepID=A0A7U2EXW7_PHANO|nr:hypothetical protein HBH56_016910 [Parastagonospora nodorum]QRC95141.1 hypothetical protein JI435_028620 [Parastagonospora nodorum SN15]KAH3937326.1 hypothetical protein HBH54_017560 [Parastagonospora nodorum]KAH3953470.1 hypothetical protein HBH53_029930 [Parastagonospora nodorum]KAH3962728.1 hypothetical protein HBH51_172050 [Parastagonospora nodorum]